MPIVADHRPRAADADRDDRADHRRGHVEVVGMEQLQPVVDHRDERAAHRPGADQRADGEQDEHRADARRHAGDGGLAERVERVAAAPADEHGDHRRDDERDLVRSERAGVAEEEERQRDQQDEADDRDDRLGERQRLGRLGSAHGRTPRCTTRITLDSRLARPRGRLPAETPWSRTSSLSSRGSSSFQ